MNTLSRILAPLALLVLGVSGCYYDNEEDLYGQLQPVGCDTLSVTYATDVVPVLARECYSCHEPSDPGGGIVLTTFEGLEASIANGKFQGAINHLPGFKKMPQGGNQLPDCELQKINAWVNLGAPNN